MDEDWLGNEVGKPNQQPLRLLMLVSAFVHCRDLDRNITSDTEGF